MNKPSEELSRLINELNQGKISPDQFERESNKLIDSIGGETETKVDPVRLERIDAAASMIRNL